MAEDLVAAAAQRLGDLRAVCVDGGVHLRLDRQIEGVEERQQPPDADPVSVVAPREDAVARCLVGRRDCRALAAPEAERLDVHCDVDGEALAAGPGVVRAFGDRRVVVTSVGFEHGGVRMK